MIRTSFLAAILTLSGCAATGPAAEPPVVAAPDIPDTEIFAGGLSFADGAPVISELKNATSRAGYDNQPSFLAGEAAFYYVAEGESGKTDIRLYDLARGASQPVFTSTDRSEYSPKDAPGGGISYIQENEAGDMTRVHLRKAGAEDGAPVADFAPLGYYAWLEGGAALGVYYRSEPGSLYRVDVASGATKLLRERIGRALQADKPGGVLWFTEIIDEEKPSLQLMSYRPASGEIAAFFELPHGAQDFAIVFDRGGVATSIVSAQGATLYWRALSKQSGGWSKAADLTGLANATRIAVSDDNRWIAIVGEKAE